MEKIIILCITLFCILMTSCKRDETIKLLSDDDKETIQKYDQIKEMQWLAGRWEYKTGNGMVKQNWKKHNDSTFSGNSYVLQGNDTIQSQLLTLEQKGDSLYYSTRLKPVNDGNPVVLTLTSFTADKYVFENHGNTYPEKIIYTRIDDNNIITEVSGMLNGRMNVEEIKFNRSKQ